MVIVHALQHQNVGIDPPNDRCKGRNLWIVAEYVAQQEARTITFEGGIHRCDT
jgi:hypothetical protein